MELEESLDKTREKREGPSTTEEGAYGQSDHDDDKSSSSQLESELSDSEERSVSPTESATDGGDITVMSMDTLREDLEKGKAAKEQVCKLLDI